MILPKDFIVRIEESVAGSSIEIVHKPTGNTRSADSVPPGAVGKFRDKLMSELRGLLFKPEDVRCDTGRSEGGDFIRVVHIPSGIERSAMRNESTHEQLLDLILDELYSTP